MGVFLSGNAVAVADDLSQVVQTRFECVAFSVLALIYLQLISQYSTWGVELLGHRDHRNEIHRLLSERLGAPLSSDMSEAIAELQHRPQRPGDTTE